MSAFFKNHSTAYLLCSVIFSSFLFSGSIGCVTNQKPETVTPRTSEAVSAEPTAKALVEVTSSAAIEKRECRTGKDPEALKFNLRLISEVEMSALKTVKAKTPGADFEPAEFLFAAGNISDTEPFISLHRECWAHFYEAKQYLEAGEIQNAAESADYWQGCLRSLFPDQLEIAEPLLKCFGTKAKPAGN